MSSVAFNDDFDWTSGAASSPSAAVGNINLSTAPISEEFFNDFDDDDDAFFSSATGGGTGDSRAQDQSAASQSAASSFGMVALTHVDAEARLSTTSMRGGAPPRREVGIIAGDGSSAADGEDIGDDGELLEIDRKYLSNLRNPNSTYRAVAGSCLVLQQIVYSSGDNGSSQSNANTTTSSASSTTQLPIQIESSSIYHIQQHQRLVHHILSTLMTCMSTHNLPSCRSLASKTLASIARASYARLRFDASLTSVRLPPSIATRLEDECGNGAAYSLVVAAIEQGDDGVSSAALEALGLLTLDPSTDNLAAEVRGIAECTSPNMFMYENDSKSHWILEHSHAIRELQSKAWEHVVFPRMQQILHRISLYSSPHLLARAIPVVTAACVHALTKGHDTMPSRRALQSDKASHGKRGWREVDAEGLAREYVEGILLPCFTDRGPFPLNQCDKALQRAIAVAFIRMSSASPHATWRLSACRHATIVLMQQLNRETSAASAAQVPKKSSTKTKQRGTASPISLTALPSSVAIETVAGTAAMLVIALRGIPLRERASGLTAVLRATLLSLPLAIPVSSGACSLDLPVGTVRGGGPPRHYRLGRIGLLTEVALSVMLDGSVNNNHITVNNTESEKKINGTRAVLLQRILQSDQLAALWEGSKDRKNSSTFHPNELVWVFCSVATRVKNEREQLYAKDTVAAVEWSNLGLVMLDSFAKFICESGHERRSPFLDASHAAYNGLFLAMLKDCGLFPPSTLSISENMVPKSLNTPSIDKTSSPVEGGPGKQPHHVASALSRITTNILSLRDKSKHTATQTDITSVESTSTRIQMIALLVDGWLGNCIINHDSKQSNEAQLDTGLAFLPLCQSEIESLLQEYRATSQEENIFAAAQLCQVLIACVEHVACMSELLTAASKEVGLSATSVLNGVIAAAKEGVPTDTKHGSKLRYQVALDANNAVARITECIHNRPQSYLEDIVSAFQVSPLVASVNTKSPMSSHVHREPIERCLWFLYNHARLALTYRTDSAAKATAPALSFSSSKLIRPHNALRIPSAFPHSTIEMYQKAHDLSLMIPAQPSTDRHNPVTLTGSSDPVSLTLSYGIRRVRKSGLAENQVLVLTIRLYNITPVPIRNGVRLDLKISQGRSTCNTTSLYKNEIKAGDFVTWEVVLENCSLGNLSVQPSVTFRELEQPSKTHKWVSDGGPDHDQEPVDDEDESVADISSPCRPVTVSTISLLQPCPLVFFGGLRRCDSNVGRGDTASFDYLWSSIQNFECTLPFVMQGGANTLDTKKGYVVLSSSPSIEDGTAIMGCAFIAPDGSRILCSHQTNGKGAHTLRVRSDLFDSFESLVGTPSSQELFLRFMFGANARVGKKIV